MKPEREVPRYLLPLPAPAGTPHTTAASGAVAGSAIGHRGASWTSELGPSIHAVVTQVTLTRRLQSSPCSTRELRRPL
jgi:hypothetical protein